MKKIDSLRIILNEIQTLKISGKYGKFIEEYEKIINEFIPDSLFVSINEVDEKLHKEAFKQAMLIKKKDDYLL